MSKEESMQIISKMIAIAKGSVITDSFYFLLWGWVAVFGDFIHFMLLKFTNYPYPYIVWPVVSIPALIVTIWYGHKEIRKKLIRTHIDKLMGFIWVPFFINYLIFCFFLPSLNFYICPLVLMMAASATLISAYIVKDKIIMIGSLLMWAGAVVCFLLKFDWQLIVSGMAIIAGYLMPGYVIKIKNKNENV